LTIDNRVPQGDVTQDTVIFYGTVAFSAATDTYASGGLAAAVNKALKNLGAYADRVPVEVTMWSTAASGFTYAYNVATGKLQILSGTAAGATAGSTELTNGTALNAATPNIFTDPVRFRAIFPRTYFP
jgi:hypothetical protein